MPTRYHRLAPVLLAVGALACGGTEEEEFFDTSFVDGEDFAIAANEGKEDTGYVTNLDGREMELTLEGEVSASAYDLRRAPLAVGQFALTYFRQKQDLYIQSLAEDYADGEDQIYWQAGTSWKKWTELTSTERAAARRFQMRKVNAVLLNAKKHGVSGTTSDKVFEATVPVKPLSLYSDVGRSCEGGDGHIPASRDTYWYVWDPAKAGCNAQKQQLKASISLLLPKGKTVYPEYDKLYADKRLDVVVFWGQVEDGALKDSDYAFTLIRQFESSLKNAGFVKKTATRGLRYERVKSGITAAIDIYSPREFAGLTDTRNARNFYDAVNTHELVVFNGHSVLGASDFWSSPEIYRNPSKYQIFLYNGCLGYEYYVAPILKGKQDMANVDIVSNVVETPFAIMVQETSTAISMMLARAEAGGTSSWQSIIGKLNSYAKTQSWYGESFYGVSGARTNTYRPPGRR